jgi:hypothetical protein
VDATRVLYTITVSTAKSLLTMNKKSFRCPYNNKECSHLNTSGMTGDIDCIDCEFYENGIRESPGCFGPALTILIIIILIVI